MACQEEFYEKHQFFLFASASTLNDSMQRIKSHQINEIRKISIKTIIRNKS